VSDRPASARDELLRLLPPRALELLEEVVVELVDERLAADRALRDDGDPDIVSYAEAARILDCSRDAVRKRAKRGRLDVRYHGRRPYVTRESLRRLDGHP
jgi:hypothetical protein